MPRKLPFSPDSAQLCVAVGVATGGNDPVAVGTGIAPRPPHGPGRARLTHPVLIAGRMGTDRGSHETLYNHRPHAFQLTGHDTPVLSPVRVSLELVPFDQSPSLHPLRDGWLSRLV